MMTPLSPLRAMRLLFLVCVMGTPGLRPPLNAAAPPQPYGPVPNQRQLQWHARELYAFLHFGVDTFTDKEWGFGDEKESVFNPTAFDAEKIVRALKAGGLRGVILTAKHHDGFCLWPSKFTGHSVKNSPWRDGKGDVLKEFSRACKDQGLAFGLYLSPWDRNHPEYGRPAYVEYYKNQIRELLTNYGPIFEMWFDGANGGDGYYGGQGGSRKVDYNTYYDWKGIRALIRSLQPECAIWCGQYTESNQVHWADCRRGGSEGGDVGDPCWHTISSIKSVSGGDFWHQGHRDGDAWCGAEGDVSIRPGWFYHASQDGQVKSPATLMNIYLSCVGRGANLILNIPPDRRGLLHDQDVKALQGFHDLMSATFDNDLASSATVVASNVRGKSRQFAGANLLDGRPETYWASDDAVKDPKIILQWTQPTTFNLVRLREYLPLGQRVEDWAIDVARAGNWKEIAHGSAIGASRIIRTEENTTDRIRIRITKAPVCPALSEIGVFHEPASGQK